jgi:hypothetical protein
MILNDKKPLVDEFREAMDLVQKKNQDYGNAFERSGQIFKLLFPDGIELKTGDDFNEFSAINAIIGKLVRFSNLWNTDHNAGLKTTTPPNFESILDTLGDLGNYAFILKNLLINTKPEEELPQ